MPLDMLGLGRLGSLYGSGEFISGPGGMLLGRYGMLAVVAMLLPPVALLLVPLLLLLPLVVAAPPCFNSVSMENPKDWADLLRPNGEASGP